MKYQNKTGVTVYTYVGGKLVAVQPGEIVEVAGYKPPPELTLVEEEEMVNAIRRRQLARAAALEAERAAKAAAQAPVEEAVEEAVEEEPKPVAKKPTRKRKAAPKKPAEED
jgi:hypothetical protein